MDFVGGPLWEMMALAAIVCALYASRIGGSSVAVDSQRYRTEDGKLNLCNRFCKHLSNRV